jgi:hypothetical protein
MTTKPELVWEYIHSSQDPNQPVGAPYVLRTKVPGGWLVHTDPGGLAFYPDPQHQWDGNSLP